MTNKRISLLAVLTLILLAAIVICVVKPGVISFMGLLIVIILSSVIILLHLLLSWRRLAITMRLSIILSILAWAGLFYGLVHANGLSLTNFFS